MTNTNLFAFVLLLLLIPIAIGYFFSTKSIIDELKLTIKTLKDDLEYKGKIHNKLIDRSVLIDSSLDEIIDKIEEAKKL